MGELKILLLEDVQTDADLIVRQLKRDNLEFTTERVDTQDEFTHALGKFKPDVILSDHALPQFNSLAALALAKKANPDAPFILVTGAVSEEFAVTCLKSGADDYILKNNLTRLSTAIKSSLERRNLATENNVVKALNKEIEKKNEELHTMNQEKDRFMGIVSHDLQNHISAMMLTLGMLAKNGENLKKNHRNYLTRLNKSTFNMQKLLSDFLTVNRVQQGVINPVYSLVNLGNLVCEVAEGYEYVAQRKEITVHVSNKCEESFFRTDVSYLSIIVDNLISNAIKYTDRGKNVGIKAYKNKKDGKYIFEVTSEGPTIPQGEMHLLYGRFQKLSPKPTAGEPSNGLGLSIVKDLVAALNATIECQSGDGATTFKVTF
jgi:signal transduction histidine kinase